MTRYGIGIGVQKAASSWLHAVLSTHPEVAAAEAKELDFFSYYHDRGYRWYEGHFGAREVRFENSPSYFHDPRAPKRLAKFAPDARIVVLLRDPVERAFSNHLHEVAKGHIPPCSFTEGLRNNPDYLDQGRYSTHLGRWLEHFGDRVLCLITEELQEDPQHQADRLAQHLGIATGHRSRVMAERRNVSDLPRSPILRKVLRAGGDSLRRAGMEEQLARIKTLPPVRAILDGNARSVRQLVPAMTETERAEVIAVLEDELRQLPRLLGRTELPWDSWRQVASTRGAA